MYRIVSTYTLLICSDYLIANTSTHMSEKSAISDVLQKSPKKAPTEISVDAFVMYVY